MGEIVKFPGHKYEIMQNLYYFEVYKNDKFIGVVSDKVPGVERFTFGFHIETEDLEFENWFIPNSSEGWETVQEAIKELELEILRAEQEHEEQDHNNIGTTRNWQDDNPFERG